MVVDDADARMSPESERPLALVTGATGFTGGYLARELRRRGYPVRALVRPGSDVTGLRAEGIEPFEGQLVRREDVGTAMRGVGVVYHIAAAYREAKHPDSYYFDVNVGGTRNILEAARAEGVGRVVHCSTAGVHGEVTTIPADESAPLSPGDVYQSSKLEGERLALSEFSRGLPGVVFRPVGIYGPGDTRFLKLFRTVANGRFRMFGSGDVLYHLTYIDDLVEGIIRCGEAPGAVGEVFLLAGPRYSTLTELVERVAEALGRPAPRGRLPLWPLLTAATVCEAICRPLGIDPPLHRRRCDFFVKDRAFTSAKARALLGYDPKVDLSEGLRRTADWYRAAGLIATSSPF
jgi:nucleoside-diphosphate-sugar epimerase